MKLETESKLKFTKAQRATGLPKYALAGVLQCLWNFAAKDAYLGDIGKFSNEDIALAIGWDGDPDELIAALVQTGWIDKDSVSRLVIHDWGDHCEDWIRKKVGREMGKPSGYRATEDDMRALRSPVFARAGSDVAQNCPTKPSLAKPNTAPRSAVKQTGEDFAEAEKTLSIKPPIPNAAGSRKRGEAGAESFGDVADRIAPQPFVDYVPIFDEDSARNTLGAIYVAEVVRVTSDDSFARGRHADRIQRLASTERGRDALDELLERVGKDVDAATARARGNGPIERPAALVSAELCRLAREVGG